MSCNDTHLLTLPPQPSGFETAPAEHLNATCHLFERTAEKTSSNEADEKQNEIATVGSNNIEERKAFDAFLRVCRSRGFTKRPAGLGSNDVCNGLNDNATLLRFFQARSFNIDGAVEQFQESWNIRNSVSAIDVYDIIDVDEFERVRGMYPHWTGRLTKRGLPICIFDTAYLDSDALALYTKQRSTLEATRQAVVLHDYLTRFVLPLCSAAARRSVTSAVYLCDIRTLTLKQTWGIRGYAQDITKILATCYPEVVDQVYVLNASPYFARIWSIIKRWVDPRTAAKLVIVPSEEVTAVLSECIDVENIPEQFGGEFEEATHGMLPVLGEDIQRVLGWQSGEPLVLPSGPIKWVALPKTEEGEQQPGGDGIGNSGKGAVPVAVAVGVVPSGKIRNEVVARATLWQW